MIRKNCCNLHVNETEGAELVQKMELMPTAMKLMSCTLTCKK
jgi:hypothetical protein